MQIILPDKVKLIIKTLQDEGYEAYAVGGCVRDSLLGRVPDDWDITTSADPMVVMKLFKRTIDTGLKHGTVTVMFGKEGYEVTTYRIDGDYEDSRHPKEVTFTKNLSEDLKRRDFTINAMAYNDEAGIVDMFDGLKDLNEGIIRAVGVPKDRFSEDALRILRAVRFSAQLNYSIELNTLDAIKELAHTLEKISAERIRVELQKLLISKHPEKILLLKETGIAAIILPEFNEMLETKQNTKHHCYDVGTHTMEALKYSLNFDDKLTKEDIKVLRLALLLHDSGKPQVKTTDENGVDHFYNHAEESLRITTNVLRRLKYDNDTINKVKILVKYHDHRSEITETKVRRTIVDIGKDLMPLWFMVRECDINAQSLYIREEKLKEIKDYKEVYDMIISRGDCISLKNLAITGKDLINVGISPGPGLGEILNRLFNHVLEEPEHNQKEILLEMASNM